MEAGPGTASRPRLEQALERLERLAAVDPLAERLADRVQALTSDRDVKNVLSGTFSGHPLHPALSDVPLGFLHSAFLMELIPTRWAARAATTLLVCGLAASVPTAVTGLSDWSDTSGAARRVGVVHGGANGVALLFYGMALARRARGHAGAGRAWSLLGYGATLVGAFLGGHLAYRLGTGVAEHADRDFDAPWRPAAPLADLTDGSITRVTVDDRTVLLSRIDGEVHAIAGTCNHAGGPLADGHLDRERREVRCPWHGSCFDVRDGAVRRGPATAPQPAYDVRVLDEQVQVRRRS